MSKTELPLFREYPLLGERLPRVPLGEFPTPVKKLDNLGRELGLKRLYIKRDDISGKIYGGNKVRKLELLLGDAIARGHREVITFGAAGSNHALATAIYGGEQGLHCSLYLVPQPNAHYVRKNLLMDIAAGADLHFSPGGYYALAAAKFRVLRERLRGGAVPAVIPFGGTTPLSIAGFVNAAFELRDQVENGRMPEPDYVYVAMGSMGTAVGLMLGLKASGMKSRVVAVRVLPLEAAGERNVVRLYHRATAYLNGLDSSFPRYELPREELDVRHNYFGYGYAIFTEESVRSVEMLHRYEGIAIEGTYTGKAFAALADDAKSGALRDKTVLFWNTCNSRDFSARIREVDYRRLSPQLQRYFTENVQPLDRRAVSA
ncbi:MAG: pyridoxal-phosphate dependent enzyme [Spirochaetes bacterium]|nr:pyridoxal-phosphate dependent enzyme [Spirochaetota bacterium]